MDQMSEQPNATGASTKEETPNVAPAEAASAEKEDSTTSTPLETDTKPEAKPAAEIPASAAAVEDRKSLSSSSSDDDEANQYVDDEGRKLSEYEIQRLERIKRNKQYLAQLGLEAKSRDGGVLGKKQQTRKKPTPKDDDLVVQPRRSMSRRTKAKQLSYAEPSNSVRKLMKLGEEPAKPPPVKKKTERKWKPWKDRMDRPIYEEFKRIGALKKIYLKQAERNFKNAHKEIKYWNKVIPNLERQYHRKREREEARKAREKEREALGGKTAKDLLQEFDSIMPEVEAAVDRYDDSLMTESKREEAAYRRRLAEHKIKTLDALDRFPSGMKKAQSLLDSLLLDRAPDDPPPPRRSKRSSLDSPNPAPPKKRRKGGKKKTGKAKAVKKAPSTTDLDNIKVAEPAIQQEADEPTSTTRTRTKKIAQNVGGWISPNFADELDRSWLRTSEPAAVFDLSTYVPQVGDIVLYYIAGHRQYLEAYPDLLGKKTRSKLRVPLWDKAYQLKDDMSDDSEGMAKDPATSWIASEWLDDIESYGRYPLLCRVERTHTEFPPDPYIKAVQKDETVIYKRPKGYNAAAAGEGEPIRLAVKLKPLSPVLPPKWDSDKACFMPSKLSLPPVFSVVTFPCPGLEPFVIPFSWAFARSYSYSVNDKVSAYDNSRLRVESFEALTTYDGLRLEDRVAYAKALIDAYEATSPKYAALEKELGDKRTLPAHEARIFVSLVKECIADSKVEGTTDAEELSLMPLVWGTLPLWHSVATVKGAHNRNSELMSPWNLVLPAKKTELLDPWELSGQRLGIDDSLLEKVRCTLDDSVAESPAAKELFMHPVTEELAPSYYCAVPLGMSLSVINQRLDTSNDSGQCYYRSVEEVVSDLSTIVDCCLLYNAPGSLVVQEANTVVIGLTDAVVFVIKDHYREIRESQKADEKSKNSLNRFQGDGSSKTPSRSFGMNRFRTPFRGVAGTDWLDGHGSGEEGTAVPFQAGDKISYSLEYHKQFVRGHKRDLESFHCHLPRKADIYEGDQADEDGWVSADVIWTSSCFPKPGKDNGKNTFPSITTLQSMGIQFENEYCCVIYWRPCAFHSDSASGSMCPNCNLLFADSFIRQVVNENDGFLSDSGHKELDACFDLLQGRILRSIPSSKLEPGMTREKVRAGELLGAPKGAYRDFPVVAAIFDGSKIDRMDVDESATASTPSKKRSSKGSGVESLVGLGYLPIWITKTAEVDEEIFSTCKTLLPCPRSCLAMVHMRLKRNFYRHAAAVANDVMEAYVSVSFAMLFEAATRKRNSISVKRISRAISTGSDEVAAPPSVSAEVIAEQKVWHKTILGVRDLFATALFAVYNTAHFSRLHGLIRCDPPDVTMSGDSVDDEEEAEEDPERQLARLRLGRYLSSLGLDECSTTFQDGGYDLQIPIMKVKPVIAGEMIKFDDESDEEVAIYVDALSAAMRVSSSVKRTRMNLLVRAEGAPVSFESAPTTEEPVPQVKVKQSFPFYYSVDSFATNDDLCRVLFARSGREQTCGRCRANGRSFFTCRVLRRHSNPDFDWIRDFRGGIATINELLDRLHPGRIGELVPMELEGSATPIVEFNVIKRKTADGSDPSSIFEQATVALEQATKDLEIARAYAEAPARLSAEFIKETIPVDDDDGHYLYCVVCGRSGDLLCCDGCSNVVHCECVGMEEPPEEDWFCEECTSKSKKDGGTETAEDATPFGRMDFDPSSLERVEKIIDDMRSARPTQKPRRKSKGGNNGADDEDADADDKLISEKSPPKTVGDKEPAVGPETEVSNSSLSKQSANHNGNTDKASILSSGKEPATPIKEIEEKSQSEPDETGTRKSGRSGKGSINRFDSL